MRFRILPVCLLAVAALVSGCGGGDDGPPALTNDVFITKADKICAQGEVDLQDRVRATFGNDAPTEEEGITFTTTETIPLLNLQIEGLRALTPPDGDEETVNEIWDAMEDGVKTLQDNPETALSGTDPMADAMELARSYGFRSCGAESSVATGTTGSTGVTGTTDTESTSTETDEVPAP